MNEILAGASIGVISGLIVGLSLGFLRKYTGKADSSETKITSLEGAIGGVSDKAFLAIKNLDDKVTIFNREREKEVEAVKEMIRTFEKHLDEKIRDLKSRVDGIGRGGQ